MNYATCASLYIHTHLFIINGISESMALLEFQWEEQSLFQESKKRRSIMYLRLVIVVTVGR